MAFQYSTWIYLFLLFSVLTINIQVGTSAFQVFLFIFFCIWISELMRNKLTNSAEKSLRTKIITYRYWFSWCIWFILREKGTSSNIPLSQIVSDPCHTGTYSYVPYSTFTKSVRAFVGTTLSATMTPPSQADSARTTQMSWGGCQSNIWRAFYVICSTWGSMYICSSYSSIVFFWTYKKTPSVTETVV
jgi:hypothetical protein